MGRTLGDLAPGLSVLRHYDRAWLRGDLLAGLTVAAYLVPQVMAYAEVAGLSPVTGLWAIIGPLAVYVVVGSSRQLSVGPESTTALMTAVALAPLAAGDPARYAGLAALLALMVGAICLLGWAVRLGFLADLLSKPVLIGYMAGVAVLMIVSQLDKVTGVPVDGDTLVDSVASFVTQLDHVHQPTALLAVSTLAFLLVGSRLFPRFPVPLAGMLLATLAVIALSLRDRGVEVIGAVPSGLPVPATPPVSTADLTALLLPAVGIAVVGYSDNVLTARALAAQSTQRVDANQELLALGVANVAAGFLRGFPVSSSASRAVIAKAVGSRTQLYSIVALAAVIVVLLVGGPVLAAFPTAALGALVIYAALRLIELGEFRRMAAFRTSEVALALTTTVAVLLFDVLYGVLGAVALSILDMLRRVARPHDGVLGHVPGIAGMHDIDDYPDAKLIPGLVVYRYDAPLFFANAEDFRRRALGALDAAVGTTEWFVLNAEANVDVDLTAIDALDELRDELRSRYVVFAMARVKQDLFQDLRRAGLVERIGTDRIFPTLPTAVQAFVEWHVQKHGEPPPCIVQP